MALQSSKMVLALSNKSVLFQWVTEGGSPNGWGFPFHGGNLAQSGGTMGQTGGTVIEMGGVGHLLNREKWFF